MPNPKFKNDLGDPLTFAKPAGSRIDNTDFGLFSSQFQPDVRPKFESSNEF